MVQVYEKWPEADEEEKKHGSKSTLLAVNCRGQHSMEQVADAGNGIRERRSTLRQLILTHRNDWI